MGRRAGKVEHQPGQENLPLTSVNFGSIMSGASSVGVEENNGERRIKGFDTYEYALTECIVEPTWSP